MIRLFVADWITSDILKYLLSINVQVSITIISLALISMLCIYKLAIKKLIIKKK